MIRSGIVTQVFKDVGGVIQDANKREFYFSFSECDYVNGIPLLHTVVTFLKDKDYTSTDVATSVKLSPIFEINKRTPKVG